MLPQARKRAAIVYACSLQEDLRKTCQASASSSISQLDVVESCSLEESDEELLEQSCL